MADGTPAPKRTTKAAAAAPPREPAEAPTAAEGLVPAEVPAPAETPAPAEVVVPAETPAPAEAVASATDGAAAVVAPVADAAPAAPAPTAHRVVYVETPAPPRPRGNRGVGAALAVLGAIVFALVYAGVAAIVISFRVAGADLGRTFTYFLATSLFWVPILVFLIGFVLMVLLVNRAGWWVHVLSSLLVATFVYFGSIGLLLLSANIFGMSAAEIQTQFSTLATNPLVIAAAIVAREVSIWIGLAIAARGRRVKARNLETRTAFERELAEKRAEHERAAAAAG